jgi:hypothetical protein
MPFANARLERKYHRFLEQSGAEHEVELDGAFTNRLAAAIRASSANERQQVLNNAIEVCESALDGALSER